MIHLGDCLEVMAAMPADSVDAVVTDPPYGLEFMGKAWDSPLRNGWQAEPGRYHNDTNFLAKGDRIRYQAGPSFQAWCEAWGREALRVTKPGGYLLAFGGTRTHHRLVCGLEDAGWIIRDELTWVYASGFPKGKANLKPAHEPIVLARKPGPLRALNIEECRIGTDEDTRRPFGTPSDHVGQLKNLPHGELNPASSGRWPSNLLLSDPELFDVANPGVVGSGQPSNPPGGPGRQEDYPAGMFGATQQGPLYFDGGGYSRFYLIPKADRADREPVLRGQLEPGMVGGRNRADGRQWDIPGSTLANGKPKRENTHATVKPTDLMRHLVRLVTPPGGTVLDCFLGSGSTAIACELEGFPWVGIEQDPGYVAIAEARLNGVQRGMGLDVPAPTRKRTTNNDGIWPDRDGYDKGEDYGLWAKRVRSG